MTQGSECNNDFDDHKIERGLNYIIVWQWVCRDKQKFMLPVLYLTSEDDVGNVSVKRFDALVDYCVERWSRSATWLLYRVRTVGLLIDYTSAWLPYLQRARVRGSIEASHERMLQRFAKAILNGTAVVENGGKVDGIGLYGQPRSESEAKRCLSALTSFLMSLSNGSDQWSIASATRYVDPFAAIRIAYQSVVQRRNSLLAHLAKSSEVAPPHAFPGYFGSVGVSAATYRFPIAYVWPFLFKGFARRDSGETDYTAQLIAFILFAGGARASELFHVWVQDVQFIENDVLLFLHHPEDGHVVDPSGKIKRRKAWLLQRNRLPRNRLRKRSHAGWKGLDGEADGVELVWLPIEELQAHLVQLFSHYLSVTRPRIMRLRKARGLPDHDYLFVGSGESRSDGCLEIGEPYTLVAFKAAWIRAVGRTSRSCNDPSLKVAKRLGTTIHGARHFYGSFLKTIGCDAETITRCMHHKNGESQRKYTRLTASEVNEILHRKSRESPSTAEMLASFMDSLQRQTGRMGRYSLRR